MTVKHFTAINVSLVRAARSGVTDSPRATAAQGDLCFFAVKPEGEAIILIGRGRDYSRNPILKMLQDIKLFASQRIDKAVRETDEVTVFLTGGHAGV